MQSENTSESSSVIHTPISTRALHTFFRQLSEDASFAVMLGGATTTTPLNQWAIMGLHLKQRLSVQGKQAQWETIEGAQTTILQGGSDLFPLLEQFQQSTQAWPEEKTRHRLPMAGGAVACVGYEFYPWCDSAWHHQFNTAKPTDWPALQLCEFEDWLLIDLESGTLTVLSANSRQAIIYQHLWQQALQIEREGEAESKEKQPPRALDEATRLAYLNQFDCSFTPEAFAQTVERIKAQIVQGEVYQANLSLQLKKTLTLDPYALFAHMCERNPSPFTAFWKAPEGLLLCNSPERLIQVSESGLAKTRPIAGTRGRGQTSEEDAAIGEMLLQNAKERAEHLMLVDLARNDLGRVCEPGSVQVDELMVLERYAHVTHVVSNVVGQVKPEQTQWDILTALFPGGTITGCPKIRCVNILDALEPVSRGLYTGGVGYLDAASHAMDFNIIIRSLYLKPTEQPLRYNTAIHVGAGIVHDAVGAHEYRECLRKASALLDALYHQEHP